MSERRKGWKQVVVATWMLFIGILMIRCDHQSSTSTIKLPDKVDFNYDVKPILVQNCYLCHGPDPGSRKADLRLDTYEGATKLREGRKAIHPGNADKSELIRRITHADADVVMPPPESNLELSEYQIEVLKKWIDQGAEWKPHWAFIKPEYSEPKAFGEKSVNEVDDFILQKMELKSLEPVQEADKNTLLRRVSYVLTGLPPTLDEIEGFVKDDSQEAYESMVDHYLNSPAFGERWARHWMDIVRYAETQGHEFDYGILGAWRYRDYLIRAFNQDVPYDQLVREHIAGDLLDSVRWNPEDGTNESHLGTIFYALGEGKHSPVDIKEEEVDRIDNMIDVTSKAFQALTVSCAKCHDHKFDPIPTEDYYGLYGVMESTRFTPVSADITYEKLQQIEKLEELKKEIRTLAAGHWKSQVQPDDEIADVQKVESNQLQGFQIIGDFRGNDLNGWKSDGLAFGTRTTLGEVLLNERSDRIEGLDEGKASSRLYGSTIFGALRSPDFTISKDFIGVKTMGNQSTIRIIIDNFQLIRNPIYGGLQKIVEGEGWQEITFDLSAWKGHKAYIEIFPGRYISNELDKYILPDDAYVDVKYAIAFDGEWPENIPQNQPGSDAENIIDKWLTQDLTHSETNHLNTLIRQGKLESNIPDIKNKFDAYREIVRHVKDSAFFMGMTEGYGIDSHVFIRGSHSKLSDKEVPRGFLSILSSDTSETVQSGSGRMELVGGILDPGNPLTSRVMVNRIWHHLFGRGIVETVDNFGLQGKLPTHPELLDFLAIKFRNEGWSVKKMIKYIVMSNTFRKAVPGAGDVQSKDPDNLYLSHYPVRRLEAEAIRDGLLYAGGNLDLTPFGPPEAVYLTEFMTGRGRPRESGAIDGNGRRTIYLGVRRNFLQPMLLTFDRPIPFTTFGNRNVTNVPAQSLILMNDPFVIHQAKLMADLILEDKDSDTEKRIEQVYLRTLSRYPHKEELVNAKSFIRQLSMTYETGSEGEKEQKIWTDFCHSIFNLKEFIYLI